MSIENRTVDTRDGEEVAKFVGGLYLNAFSSRSAFHPIFAAYKNPAHNFTVLIIQWMYYLSRAEYYDDRNKASVLFAKDMVRDMQLCNDYDYLSLLRNTAAVKEPVIQIIDFNSHIEMANILRCHLSGENHDNGIYKGFIKRMLNEHKTLQQSFTRFCRDWCRYVVNEKPFGAKSKTVLLAKPIANSQHGLPMI